MDFFFFHISEFVELDYPSSSSLTQLMKSAAKYMIKVLDFLASSIQVVSLASLDHRAKSEKVDSQSLHEHLVKILPAELKTHKLAEEEHVIVDMTYLRDWTTSYVTHVSSKNVLEFYSLSDLTDQ